MVFKMANPKIITLSNFLRKEGMIVSIRSTITASKIWEQYNETFTENQLKESLKCIYIKNKEDISKFDKIYDELFFKIPEKPKQEKEPQNPRHKYNENDENETINQNFINNQTKEYLENQELIENRKEKKVIDNKLVQDSIVTLDNTDKRVFDICQRLSKKIANQRSKRKKRFHSHNINMPYTIRHNLKNGGHLIRLIHQKPPVRKTKQIFLSDISGSCEWISTWFFAILYGCYKTFDKVTIYDFDNKIVDVTDTLSSEYENTYQINFAHQSLGVRPFGQSDMTNAFQQFLDEATLNNHTDVIILTDCRDWTGKREDGVLESAKILHEIVRKSRRVIILNPEKKIRWKTATSCVDDYKRAGAIVYETGTLDQFARVISTL